jgi:DNA-binding SARP family transcriptional activator
MLGRIWAASRVSLQLLGECRVSIGDRQLSSIPFGFFHIAAYVLLEGKGQTVARRRIAQLLWSESRSAQANADIRQTIARIRRFQAEHRLHLIGADASVLWVTEDNDARSDLAELLAELNNPEGPSAVRLCELYGGNLLDTAGAGGDGFEEWLSFQRAHLHRAVADIVSRAISPAGDLTSRQRDFCARRLLMLDPCHEGAYRALMRGAAESGHISMVHSLFEDCTRRLSEDLGVGPEAETLRLFQQLTNRTMPLGSVG